ncbi:hypothetical protein RRG08_023202 [Elysia crispata]|uniref:Uncharacterized protein n=1 Tax=Elysia crispata TaxID=231223 RepID=A0AAE0ZQQ9_9GAST|nr:hypothetical protein RRG08_023202 [Elysia crispata]
MLYFKQIFSPIRSIAFHSLRLCPLCGDDYLGIDLIIATQGARAHEDQPSCVNRSSVLQRQQLYSYHFLIHGSEQQFS